MRLTLDYPPVWLIGFLAAAWGVTQIFPGGFNGLGVWPGTALAALGIGLMGVAAIAMLRARTTIVPHEVPTALVTSGIFRLTRNPIYLGDTMVLLGLILRWDVAVALPLVVLFVWIIQTRFIAGEEARLRARFGVEFDTYAAGTRRWL